MDNRHMNFFTKNKGTNRGGPAGKPTSAVSSLRIYRQQNYTESPATNASKLYTEESPASNASKCRERVLFRGQRKHLSQGQVNLLIRIMRRSQENTSHSHLIGPDCIYGSAVMSIAQTVGVFENPISCSLQRHSIWSWH